MSPHPSDVIRRRRQSSLDHKRTAAGTSSYGGKEDYI